jgi:hypothetical protein
MPRMIEPVGGFEVYLTILRLVYCSTSARLSPRVSNRELFHPSF